jgi:hypothetical protein
VPDEEDQTGLYGVARIPIGVLQLARAAKQQPRPYVGSILIVGLLALMWMVDHRAPSPAYGVLALLLLIGVCAGVEPRISPASSRMWSRICPWRRRRLR